MQNEKHEEFLKKYSGIMDIGTKKMTNYIYLEE